MPRRALRSVIDFGSPSQEDLIANILELLSSNIEWDRPADYRIFEFLKLYFHSTLKAPTPQVIIDYFENRGDEECKECVGDIECLPAYVGSSYSALLGNVIEVQSNLRAVNIFREAEDVIRRGLIVNNEERRGLVDGINHLTESLNQLLTLRGPQAPRIHFTIFERVTQDENPHQT